MVRKAPRRVNPKSPVRETPGSSPPGMIVGRLGCDRAAFASAGPACRAAVTHPARRLAVRAGPRRCFPVVGKDLRVALTGSLRAGCRQRRDPDGSAPKALRMVIA